MYNGQKVALRKGEPETDILPTNREAEGGEV